MLVNVKRLHPLAGQIHLIDALPSVLADHPDTRLVVCGAGPLRESLAARAAERGVAANVTFTGLIDNHLVARYQQSADLFVLPSDLEALPTVAIEALASGTPVVSTDNPGGMELQRLFEDDVRIVPRGSPGELGAAISAFLGDVRRTRPRSDHILQEEFAPSSVAARFRAVYLEACSAAAPQVSSPTR
jgi:glycosyltransferase involved in cell wall biosynthesis